MSFFRNLFKKKFDVDAAKRELLSVIRAIEDERKSSDINKALDRLVNEVKAISSQEDCDSLARQIEQLKKDIDGLSNTKAIRIINRAVDDMTGRGRELTDTEKIVDENQGVIEDNSQEIDDIYYQLREAEAKVKNLQSKLDNAKSRSDALRYRGALAAAKSEKAMLEKRMNYLVGSISQRSNINLQINTADLQMQSGREQVDIAQQMQSIDMADMNTISEMRQEVIANQMEQSNELDKIANFEDIPDFFEDDENERAEETMFELNKSLDGKSMDEALSELGSDEDL